MADYFRRNNARVILDLAWTKFLPIPEMREYHEYAFDFQRKHPDVVFGHWIILDPRKGQEAVRRIRARDRRGTGLHRPRRLRPGRRRAGRRPVVGSLLQGVDRCRPAGDDHDRPDRHRAGPARGQRPGARRRPSAPHRPRRRALSRDAHPGGASGLSLAGRDDRRAAAQGECRATNCTAGRPSTSRRRSSRRSAADCRIASCSAATFRC